jgi:taurine transport system substrate-binding protein
MMHRKAGLCGTVVLAAGLLAGAGGAAAQSVTVGYQLIYNPWKVPIADDTFSKTTGWDVEYRQFDSGAKVITAMASGDLQIALAGSAGIATGASQGLDIQLVWIVEDIAAAEALSRARAPASPRSRISPARRSAFRSSRPPISTCSSRSGISASTRTRSRS